MHCCSRKQHHGHTITETNIVYRSIVFRAEQLCFFNERRNWNEKTASLPLEKKVTTFFWQYTSLNYSSHSQLIPARQNGDFGRNSTYFPLIFHRFSARNGTPSLLYIYISDISVEFGQKKFKHGTPSVVFLPTFLQILPIFHLCSADFLLIFCLTYRSFCAGPVLQGCAANITCFE